MRKERWLVFVWDTDEDRKTKEFSFIVPTEAQAHTTASTFALLRSRTDLDEAGYMEITKLHAEQRHWECWKRWNELMDGAGIEDSTIRIEQDIYYDTPDSNADSGTSVSLDRRAG